MQKSYAELKIPYLLSANKSIFTINARKFLRLIVLLFLHGFEHRIYCKIRIIWLIRFCFYPPPTFDWQFVIQRNHIFLRNS